jgi:hypothetical protein
MSFCQNSCFYLFLSKFVYSEFYKRIFPRRLIIKLEHDFYDYYNLDFFTKFIFYFFIFSLNFQHKHNEVVAELIRKNEIPPQIVK